MKKSQKPSSISSCRLEFAYSKSHQISEFLWNLNLSNRIENFRSVLFLSSVPFCFVQSSAAEFISAFWFSAAGVQALCCSPWGKGLVWCSSQLFGSVLLGSSESQTGSCRKSRAQSKIGASPAANKCFKFGRYAPPTSLTLGGLSRRYLHIKCL